MLFPLEKSEPFMFEAFYNAVSYRILTVMQMILIYRKLNDFFPVKYYLVDIDQVYIVFKRISYYLHVCCLNYLGN